jgi:hypothetical protein
MFNTDPGTYALHALLCDHDWEDCPDQAAFEKAVRSLKGWQNLPVNPTNTARIEADLHKALPGHGWEPYVPGPWHP